MTDGRPLVLNVDDREIGRYTKNRDLARAGFAVIEAATGADALRMVEEHHPHVVLLDVQLPDINGTEVCAAIKARWPEVMVLQTSATFTTPADRTSGLDSGADSYLVQPAEPQELAAAVRALLRIRKAEDELRRVNETLERRVEERTRDLAEANDRLRHEIVQREKAEAALAQSQKMEIIGQLTGGVAHDFNNLLTIIMGNVDILQRHLPEDVPDRLKRALDNAARGARRASSLTQSLLAFARRQPLDPKPTDVDALVGNISEMLRRTFGEQIAITPMVADDLWRVNADPNQLESAILNLAVNARDAMPNGGRITIEAANAELDDASAAREAEVVPGPYVVIAVTDTGVGMTRDVIAQAFEPFFTTKDIGHGTGLGLSQVYGFVKQSGGHVRIHSEVGHGTTVKIYLPRFDDDDAASEHEPAAHSTPAGHRHETILVVEDDPDVREHSAEILGELGYRVLQAENGPAALAVLEREQVTLLFTDLGLPGGMNGRELADEATRRRPEVRVIFTTGHATSAIVHDGRLDPGLHLIAKPFTYSGLAAKLRSVLDHRAEASAG
ncbi:response regulator [Rhodoplanes sp. TEM]|uniref:histidine kinase n=1 Tax=Rhodoplanes tepidamans TaxID=200616 RepID=A0ABT5J7X7_RHOTP|nr:MULTISPECIES: response regulator [Rhodoplanes]MDC7785135.1 response regulator [Rhodoplanes tepidamans]MDC7982609.1 response regulator [Rhodoplanes sp. TEM]MDQ0356625.1 signal transduction histidine kinase [Rhodoplanes tepidamans]